MCVACRVVERRFTPEIFGNHIWALAPHKLTQQVFVKRCISPGCSQAQSAHDELLQQMKVAELLGRSPAISCGARLLLSSSAAECRRRCFGRVRSKEMFHSKSLLQPFASRNQQELFVLVRGVLVRLFHSYTARAQVDLCAFWSRLQLVLL